MYKSYDSKSYITNKSLQPVLFRASEKINGATGIAKKRLK